jgi:DNA ligase (NAD+)
MSKVNDKNMQYTAKFLADLQANPIEEAKKLGISKLEKLLTDATSAYYSDKELISDIVYDELIDYLAEVAPKSSVLKQIGNEPVDDATKVKLPYHLGSMDKIKPGSRKLDLWFDKFSIGPYVISDKLDGLSGLLVVELDRNNNLKTVLYTRGNGTYGQDVSHLLDLINWGSVSKIKKAVSLMDNKRIVVRGEIIINEELFMRKYSTKYPKSRSLVAGIVNSKPDSRSFAANKSITADIEFIAYQLVEPVSVIANKQFELLAKYGFITVENKVFVKSPKSELDELFIERRNTSKYKIDGIIITDCSSIYENPKSGNPKHSIAFKMPLTDQQSDTTVEEVEWNISKNGILKPRIRYQPIKIDGDTLTYTTGFNAKYIKDNKLGPGARIRIIRSGDVIPYIKDVISASKSGSWSEPSVAYSWSETGVEAIATDLTGVEYLGKQLVHFFKVMGVDGMKLGTINKLINAGFDTLETILELRAENLLDVAGFNVKSAEKLVDNLKKQLINKEHKMEVVMTASNIFTGFAVKKLALIVDYMRVTGYTLAELTIDKIATIEGFSTISAKKIITMIPDFVNWQKRFSQIKVEDIYSAKPLGVGNSKKTGLKQTQLTGKNIVLTGFRDADLVANIEAQGAKNQSGVNGKTDILVIKDDGAAKGSKYSKAMSLGITVLTLADFKKKYF